MVLLRVSGWTGIVGKAWSQDFVKNRPLLSNSNCPLGHPFPTVMTVGHCFVHRGLGLRTIIRHPNCELIVGTKIARQANLFSLPNTHAAIHSTEHAILLMFVTWHLVMWEGRNPRLAFWLVWKCSATCSNDKLQMSRPFAGLSSRMGSGKGECTTSFV